MCGTHIVPEAARYAFGAWEHAAPPKSSEEIYSQWGAKTKTRALPELPHRQIHPLGWKIPEMVCLYSVKSSLS